MKIYTISPERHLKARIKQGRQHYRSQAMQYAFLTLPEFESISTQAPIVFIRKPSTQNYYPVVLMSLTEKHNSFYQQGKLTLSPVPVSLMVYPFALKFQKNNEFLLGLVEDENVVSVVSGNALFKANGEQSDWFIKEQQRLRKLVELEQETATFTEKMASLGLFKPFELPLSNVVLDVSEEHADVSTSGAVKSSTVEKTTIEFFVINQLALANLSDVIQTALDELNMTEHIELHIESLNHFERLQPMV